MQHTAVSQLCNISLQRVSAREWIIWESSFGLVQVHFTVVSMGQRIPGAWGKSNESWEGGLGLTDCRQQTFNNKTLRRWSRGHQLIHQPLLFEIKTSIQTIVFFHFNVAVLAFVPEVCGILIMAAMTLVRATHRNSNSYAMSPVDTGEVVTERRVQQRHTGSSSSAACSTVVD